MLHNFSIANVASNDARIGSCPGVTNNILRANIEGNSNGVLSLTFSSLPNRLGFGWALLANGGGTIELFDLADISLGSLNFSGVLDPTFVGGFAGLESSTAFARAKVSWNLANTRFAFDNLRFENSNAVFEPATLALAGLALLGLAAGRRRGPSAITA